MFQKMKDKKKGMHPLERKAKMGVVGDLQKMAEDAMGGKLQGLKKVSVASDSPEGLQTGLEHAQHMLGQHPDQRDPASEDQMYAEGGMVETHPEGALSEEDHESPVMGMNDAEDDSHPDHENFTHSEEHEDGEDGMSAYPDADGDHLLEAHEAAAHQEDEMHEGAMDESEDSINKQIEMLMEKKRKRGMK